VIIALGESIVLIGGTTSQLPLATQRDLAFALAFLVTAALWWLYFDAVAALAEQRLERASERTRVARDGFTYLHGAIVAGVVATAVGQEIVIAHPGETLARAEVVAVVAGPALYLLALTTFKARMAGLLARERLAGAVVCVAIAPLGAVAPAVVLQALLAAVLVAVVVLERANRPAGGHDVVPVGDDSAAQPGL
jgi:low temperature requirement protein LtrA